MAPAIAQPADRPFVEQRPLGTTIRRDRSSANATIQLPEADFELYGRIEATVQLRGDTLSVVAPLAEQSTVRRIRDNLLAQVVPNAREYILTIRPVFDGVSLGDRVLLRLSYNDIPRRTISTRLTELAVSPWQRIRPGESLSYEIRQYGSDTTQARVAELLASTAQLLAPLGSVAGGGAGWAISNGTLEAMRPILSGVDATIGAALTSGQFVGESELSLGPGTSVAQRRSSFWAADRLVLSTNDGLDLADVSVRLVFSRSLARVERREEMPAPDNIVSPLSDPVLRSIRLKHGADQDGLLYRQLRALNFYSAFEAAARQVDAARFAEGCGDLRDELRNRWRLARQDTVAVLYEVAASVGYLRQRPLFDSGCISPQDRELLVQMRVPLAFAGVTRPPGLLDNKVLEDLIAQMGSGRVNDLRRLIDQFHERVTVTAGARTLAPEAITPTEETAEGLSMSELLTLLKPGTVRQGMNGCFGNPPEGWLDRTLLILGSHRGAVPATMQLSISDENGAQRVNRIIVSPASRERIQRDCTGAATEIGRRLIAAMPPPSPPRPR